jgi:hypothetical protein
MNDFGGRGDISNKLEEALPECYIEVIGYNL